jgi:hypothetical protein
MRRRYLPIVSANPHLDMAGILLSLEEGNPSEQSYVNTMALHMIDYGELRPWDKGPPNAKLNRDSYITLVHYIGFSPPASTLNDLGNEHPKRVLRMKSEPSHAKARSVSKGLYEDMKGLIRRLTPSG